MIAGLARRLSRALRRPRKTKEMPSPVCDGPPETTKFEEGNQVGTDVISPPQSSGTTSMGATQRSCSELTGLRSKLDSQVRFFQTEHTFGGVRGRMEKLPAAVDMARRVTPRIPAAICFAIAGVAVATAARMLLGMVGADSAVFAPYYSATLVAALAGGSAAGIIAMLLGGAIGYCLFLPPEWTLTPFPLGHLVSLGLYGASSVVIIWAAETYRSLLCRLREQEDHLRLLNAEPITASRTRSPASRRSSVRNCAVSRTSSRRSARGSLR